MSRHVRTALAGLALVTTIAGAPAFAETPTSVDTLRMQCHAGGGTFGTGYGYHRCFGAELDGTGQFTSEAQVCERVKGTSFLWAQTPDDYYGPGRGNWICSIR